MKNHAYYSKVQQWLEDYKMARGCADCGYCEHPAGLEFHHPYGSDKEICGINSFPKAKREVYKCIVLCAICHRIRHHG